MLQSNNTAAQRMCAVNNYLNYLWIWLKIGKVFQPDAELSIEIIRLLPSNLHQ